MRAYMAVLWSTIALLAAAPTATLADLKKVEERAIGRWILSAVADEAGDGGCLVSSTNDRGEILSILIERPKHRWSLAITSGNLRLREGVASAFAVSYAIDDGAAMLSKAIPAASGRVFIPLGRDFALTEPVRRGSRIAFETADGTHVFSLAGASAALDALSDCAARHLGYSPSSVSPG